MSVENEALKLAKDVERMGNWGYNKQIADTIRYYVNKVKELENQLRGIK